MLWSTFGVKPLRDVLVAQGVVPPPGFDLPNEVRVTSDRTRVFGNYRIQGTSNLAAFIATIRPPCPGDITANGTVATDDLVAFLAAFGTCPGAPSYTSGADFSGPSNCIDTADLVNLLARFGQVCP